MAVERDMRGAVAASLAVHALLGLWVVGRPATRAPLPGPSLESALTEVVFIDGDELAIEPKIFEGDRGAHDGVATPKNGGGGKPGVAPEPSRPARPDARRLVARRTTDERRVPPAAADAPTTDSPPGETGRTPNASSESSMAMRRFSPRAALGGMEETGRAGAAPGVAAGRAKARERPAWMPTGSPGPGGGGPAGVGDGSSLGTPSGNGRFIHDRPGFRAVTRSDGRVVLKDKPNVGIDYVGLGAGIGFTGHFDVTDWVERLAGNDPYAYEKRKYLDATRDQRARMIARHERDVRRAAAMRLRGHLRRLWNDRSYSPEQRRRQLFELWDECDASELREYDDDPRRRAAAFARATIEGFIRRRLPADSAHAFTPSELDRFNRQRESADLFDPYTDRSVPPDSQR